MRTVPAEAQRMAAIVRERMGSFVGEWRRNGFDVGIPEGSPYVHIPLVARSQCDVEAFVLSLARECGIIVHDGALYGMPSPTLIATCIHRPPWPIAKFADISRDFKLLP